MKHQFFFPWGFFLSSTLLLNAFLSSPLSHAAEVRYRSYLKPVDGEDPLTGFDLQSIQITEESPARYGVVLSGRFDGNGRVLASFDGPIKLDSNDRFEIHSTTDSPHFRLVFFSVDDFGKVQQSALEIEITDWDHAPEQDVPIILTPSLGFTTLGYREGSISEYQADLMTLKASVSRRFGIRSPWDAGVSGYWNALILSKNEDTSARFWGFNARIGRDLPFLPQPWTLRLHLGYYLTSMIVSPSVFGFSGLKGPQIFATLSHPVGATGTNAIGGYVKYSPISQNFWISDPTSDRELAVGMNYQLENALSGNLPLFFALDLSELHLNYLQGEVLTHSLTLSLGTSFQTR